SAKRLLLKQERMEAMSAPARVLHLHHLLKKQETVAKETGVGERLVRHIMNDPGYPPSDTTRALINKNYDRIVPFPVPADIRPFRTDLVIAKANPGGQQLEEVLIKMDGLLRLAHAQTAVDSVSLSYLRVLSSMSKGLHHGGRGNWFGGRLAW